MLKVWLRRIPALWLVVIGCAFLAGLAIQPGRATLAGEHREGFQNRVLEVTASGAGMQVRDAPTLAGNIIDTLYWGDRVLSTGQATDAEGIHWLKVGISLGGTGWIAESTGATIEMDPVYTTPGMGLNAVMRVTQMGDESHCRAEPSAASTEAQTMQAGDQAVVVGGPYQAQYWIWWQYELSGGHQCWIVDIPGWFEVVTPGTF